MRSLSAPSARYDSEEGTLLSDTPGPLPVSAVVSSVEPTGEGCDATVTSALSLLAPRPLEFAFRVTRPSSGVDLRPVTARTRVIRNPACRPRARRRRRESSTCARPTATTSLAEAGAHRYAERAAAPGVIVRRSGGGFAVQVGPLPISDPPQATGGRRISRPYGVDVELLQGGRRIARLRVAGRCDGFVGLSSALIRRPTPKLSRKLG